MTRTILIADDDPVALRLLELQLQDAGYRVVTARDGQEAFAAMLKESPPMLITDWHMPKMDGLELCRRCREFEGFGWVYTIVLTSHGDSDRVVEAFESGADDYLTKPCDQRELLARIRAGERIVDLERDLARKTREIFRNNAQLEVAYRKLASANEKLELMSRTDDLTGLANRRAAMTDVESKWSAVGETWGPMALVIFDIDHFKGVNDTYGHDVGDLALEKTAEVVRQTTRASECVYRIGGEEFMLFCPLATSAMAAVAAERLRAAIERMTVETNGREIHLTISLGVAERTEDMHSIDDLIKSADDALYEAKAAGRNCARIAPGPAYALSDPNSEQDPEPAELDDESLHRLAGEDDQDDAAAA